MIEEEPEIINNKKSIIFVSIFLFVCVLLAAAVVVMIGRNAVLFNFSTLAVSKTLDLRTGVGESTITIKEDEVNQTLKNQNFLINPKARILPEAIKITGKTSDNFFALRLEIQVLPKVRDGMIYFEIISFKSAGVIAPKKIVDNISPPLNDYLNNILRFPENFKPTGLHLSTGYLTIYGEIVR